MLQNKGKTALRTRAIGKLQNALQAHQCASGHLCLAVMTAASLMMRMMNLMTAPPSDTPTTERVQQRKESLKLFCKGNEMKPKDIHNHSNPVAGGPWPQGYSSGSGPGWSS